MLQPPITQQLMIRSVQDVATFCEYLQQQIPSYYNLVYYPDLATIQLIVHGSPSQTDMDNFNSTVANYGPVPQLQIQLQAYY